MTECYFTPKKDTTSATICANCGLEKMLHTIGEGMKVNKVIIISDSQDEITAEDDFYFDEDGDPEFQRCSDCDGHDACADFGCAIKSGIIQPSEW